MGGEEVGCGTGLYWRPAIHDAAIELAIDNGEASPEQFRLYCGYTGWGPEQLEGEIEQNVRRVIACITSTSRAQQMPCYAVLCCAVLRCAVQIDYANGKKHIAISATRTTADINCNWLPSARLAR